MMKIFPLVLILCMVFSSCSKKDNQAETDDLVIQNYLKTNNLTATKDPSGLYYIMTVPGSGLNPTSSSTIEVSYKGTLINGTVFDQNADFTYALASLIKGWQIGIMLMKKGGKATFFIPSALGYGGVDTGPIPANSVLIFNIELINIK
jgi:FKBP-type peptidyl-prolyl cis-trans isomerase FkpA